jgi:hypothetical protein
VLLEGVSHETPFLLAIGFDYFESRLKAKAKRCFKLVCDLYFAELMILWSLMGNLD